MWKISTEPIRNYTSCINEYNNSISHFGSDKLSENICVFAGASQPTSVHHQAIYARGARIAQWHPTQSGRNTWPHLSINSSTSSSVFSVQTGSRVSTRVAHTRAISPLSYPHVRHSLLRRTVAPRTTRAKWHKFINHEWGWLLRVHGLPFVCFHFPHTHRSRSDGNVARVYSTPPSPFCCVTWWLRLQRFIKMSIRDADFICKTRAKDK